ncbi:hypothetical protein ACFFLS_06350 [Flavobacterium procerum]|uniref:DUF4595 domain-containing protein n=1 Tax=Flavobacterium procerum TaxID=1455569 RepID=A0ABV6BMI5_9FLAO
MKLFKVLFIALITTSCSSEDSTEINFENKSPVTEINPYIYDSGLSNGLKMAFEYDSNKRLIKKNGGFVAPIPIIGFGGFYSNDVYTILTYNGKNITIENFSNSPDFSIPKDTRILTLNASNKIETREIPNLSYNYQSKKQTFTYSENKLVKIVTTFPNRHYDATDPTHYILTNVEQFYYDLNGNLTKAEYLEQHNGIDKGEKIIRTFEDYDKAENPLQDFQLLDEFFYRSLSKNNFRKYSESQYRNDDLIYTSIVIWTFNYELNGKIIIK